MYSNGRQDELEPRPVPKPTQFQEISAKPEVPELSVVFESSESNYSKPPNKNMINPPHAVSHTTQETYSEWKERQNRSPIHKETHYYDSRERNYYGSSTYSDCDQNPYSHFSDRVSYKTSSDCHKCACQNAPTVKDIYNMMQIQNDQIKFLLETIQTLLVTVLSNQQTQHKCCCSINNICKANDKCKTELSTKNEILEESHLQNSNDGQKEKPHTTLNKTDKIVHKKNKSNTSLKCYNKPNKMTVPKNKPKNPQSSKHNGDVDEKSNKKDTERTYSIGSDESFDLNENDVQVTETPISPEPSIHIEMKSSSSEDSTNSESDKEENDKQIEVGWTMYKNIIGQVNNLLEDTNSEQKSEMTKPAECVKHAHKSEVAKSAEYVGPESSTKPKNFEQYAHFMLPENGKIDSSLQMKALALQYLSPEQAVNFDMNKHFVPKTQCAVKSPNNYSISTMHYMERYHLIGPEINYNSEKPFSLELIFGEASRSRKKLRGFPDYVTAPACCNYLLECKFSEKASDFPDPAAVC